MANNKSQAALEFIMTYGWAILVVLVAIAALAYFGVLNPDKFLPRKCLLQAGIACTDFKITSSSLVMYIQNSLGRDINIDAVKANGCTALGNLGTVANGGTFTITFNNTCSNIGAKYNGQVNLTLTYVDTQIQHNIPGEITGAIE